VAEHLLRRRTVVFERGYGIWHLDTDSGRASEVRITRRGAPVGAFGRKRQADRPASGTRALARRQEGRVRRARRNLRGIGHGRRRCRARDDDAAPESQPVWDKESRRLAYVSARNGAGQLFLYDFATNAETQLTSATEGDDTPRFSPDGKWLAFERGGREIRALNLETKQERVVAEGALQRPPLSPDRPFVWSPDSKWIAYIPVGQKLFRNVYVAPIEDGGQAAARQLPRQWREQHGLLESRRHVHPLRHGAENRAGPTRAHRPPAAHAAFREDQFRDLFKEETPKNVSPTLRRQENNPQSPATPTPTPLNTQTPTPTATPTATPTPTRRQQILRRRLRVRTRTGTTPRER
jgi:tricorn protease